MLRGYLRGGEQLGGGLKPGTASTRWKGAEMWGEQKRLFFRRGRVALVFNTSITNDTYLTDETGALYRSKDNRQEKIEYVPD